MRERRFQKLFYSKFSLEMFSSFKYAPTISVDLERSFFAYRHIITNHRFNLTENNMKHIIKTHRFI